MFCHASKLEINVERFETSQKLYFQETVLKAQTEGQTLGSVHKNVLFYFFWAGSEDSDIA